MSILTPFLELAAPTLVRHVIAWLSGFLLVNAGSLNELLAGVLCFIVPVLWSYFTHEKMSEENQTQVKSIARALTTQATAAISGALMQHGFTGDPNDTVAIALFGVNYAHSLRAQSAEKK